MLGVNARIPLCEEQPLLLTFGDGTTGRSDCGIRLIEQETRYLVYAHLPHLHKQDINVSIEGNRVVLAADRQPLTSAACRRKQPWPPANDSAYELIHTFLLDHPVDVIRARATHRNGELELILPKSTHRGRRLLIN